MLQREQNKKLTPAPAIVPPELELEPERSSTFMEFLPVSMPRYTSRDACSGTFATNVDGGRGPRSPILLYERHQPHPSLSTESLER